MGMARPWAHPTKTFQNRSFFAWFFPCFFASIFGPFCLPTCPPKTIKIDEKSMPRCIPTWIPFLQSRPRGLPHRTVRWDTALPSFLSFLEVPTLKNLIFHSFLCFGGGDFHAPSHAPSGPGRRRWEGPPVTL